MKKSLFTITVVLMALAFFTGCTNVECSSSDCSAQKKCVKGKKERKIGVQLFTFHKKYTLEETIPVLEKSGIYGLGITAGQNLSKKYPKLRFGPKMNAEQRQWFKDLINSSKCKIVSFGVINPKTEAEVKELCEFAKEMGVPMLLTESAPELMPVWDKYAQANGVKVAVHNHAANSRNNYYNPYIVRKMIKPLKNVGACPDNGHWSRSGIDPVLGYKALEGEIYILHFKDQAEFGNPINQCVPYGTGELDMKAMLAELDRQGFDGYFLIEYEAKWHDNLEDVIKCAEYLKNN